VNTINGVKTIHKTAFLSLIAKLQKIMHVAEIDSAVFFSLLSKLWSIVAGPITVILIAYKFTPELQGYYFTFINLIALQVFIELGLGVVIIQFASHEWSKLSLNKAGYIVGESEALSRLISLAKITIKWYLIGSLIAIFGLGIVGYIFFSQSQTSNLNWMLPWLIMCLITGGAIFLIPIWSLLEGCNQVSTLYAFRLWQGIFSNICAWISISFGAGLWALIVANAVTLICGVIFLGKKYPNFIKSLLFSQSSISVIKWRNDILPMQWRIAVSYISGYFANFIFTPVLFHYHGAVTAGQFGMTWNIIFNIGVISMAWLNPKIPRFGMLIAQQKYKELDDLFWRLTKIIITVVILLSVSFWLTVYLLNRFEYTLSNRLLSPLPTMILLLAIIVLYTCVPFATYIHAHKKEPLVVTSVLSGLLTALFTLILGKYYSSTGAAIGFLANNLIIVPIVIIICYRCRIAWHK